MGRTRGLPHREGGRGIFQRCDPVTIKKGFPPVLTRKKGTTIIAVPRREGGGSSIWLPGPDNCDEVPENGKVPTYLGERTRAATKRRG